MPFAYLLISCFVDLLKIACLIVVPLSAVPSSKFLHLQVCNSQQQFLHFPTFKRKNKQFFDTGLEKETTGTDFFTLILQSKEN
jgi:hypothetical protein